MSDLSAYLWCALGIAISVLLPILWEIVYRYFPKRPQVTAAGVSPEMVQTLWKVVAPYLVLGIASLLTSILIVAVLHDSLQDSRAALLAGYAWDSTLQKLRR